LTITQGSKYTLDVDVGARAGQLSTNGNYWIQLYALAPDLTSHFITQSYGNPSIDTFSKVTVPYLADSTYNGDILGIALVGAGSNVGGYQINFDNVRLDVVPEPTTLLFLGAGLVGLAVMRRRIKK
jgi:hypothetical protein